MKQTKFKGKNHRKGVEGIQYLLGTLSNKDIPQYEFTGDRMSSYPKI